MIREFIAGDRVQSKHGGPTMEVTKYIMEHHLGVGETFSDHNVKCIWYKNGARKTKIFDQRTLFKVHSS